MTKKYQDEHAEAVHEWATYAFRIGRITKERMKEFDDMCLVQEVRRAPDKRSAVGESGAFPLLGN